MGPFVLVVMFCFIHNKEGITVSRVKIVKENEEYQTRLGTRESGSGGGSGCTGPDHFSRTLQ